MVDAAVNKSILNAYDEIAPVYAEYASKRASYLESIDRLVISNLRPDMRLLDVGSGDGKRLKKILEQSGVINAIAVEPSAEMAKLCRIHARIPVYEVTAESIKEIAVGQFDVITALWNVLGHIQSEARIEALIQLRDSLLPKGCLLLDVNNRHNAAAYGKWKVIGRRIIDAIDFREERGDTYYAWKIGERSIPSYGHLFTPKEIEKLIKKVGMKILRRVAVDYATGKMSEKSTQGQLFYTISSDDN